MGIKGKWGITRDPDGSLAYILEWPWYWRYPAGAAIAIGTAWMLANIKGPWGAMHWIILASGIMLALSAMYELIFLGISLAIFAGILWVIGLFVPDEAINSLLSKPITAIVLIAILWWQLWNTRQRLSDAERTIKHLAGVIDYHRQSELDSREIIHENLGTLADRVHDLERPLEDHPWR